MKFFYSLLVIVLLTTQNLFPQEYNFINYSLENGLSQSQVHSMLEDSRGFMWIGTDGGGLDRFDGTNFYSYTVENGLQSDRIRCLYEDKANNIWIGAENGYVTKFDGHRFFHYGEEDGLKGETIISIVEDNNGVMWFGSLNNGLFKFIDNEFINIRLSGHKNVKEISALTVVREKLWVGTKGFGTFIFVKDEIKTLNTKDGLSNNNINDIIYDNNNTVWIATENGVNSFRNNSIIKFYKSDGLVCNNINNILVDGNSYLWFSSNKNGASKFNGFKFINYNDKNGLKNNFILSMTLDRYGSVWFGTDGSGIFKFSGDRFKNYHFKNNNIIMSIYEDKDLNIWFGTYGGGICKFDGKNYTYFTTKNGLCGDIIYCISQDSKGDMWFGSKGKGLSIYDGEKFRNYSSENSNLSNFIYSIKKDSKGKIWLASNDKGLYVFENNKFTNISKKEGLPSNQLYCLLIDKKDNLWIGTQEDGVLKFNAKDNLSEIIKTDNVSKYYKQFKIDNGKKQNSTMVLSLLEDSKANIWFGTFGKGVYKYNGTSLTHYTKKTGLVSNYSFFLLEDSRNLIWVGTENGLSRIGHDPRTGKPFFRTYNKYDGFVGLETNLNAAIKDNNNELWFGTIKGAIKYEQNVDLPNKIAPKTHITNIRLFYKDVDWKNISRNKLSWFNIPDSLELKHKLNNLTFDFVGIDLLSPQKVKFKWMLEGFDNDFSPYSNQNNVTYSNLQSGEYCFKLKSINNDGIESDVESLNFTIQKAFWQTVWFYIVIIIALIGFVYLVVKHSKRKAEREKFKLKQMVDLRSHQLMRQNKTVEQQKAEITQQKEEIESQADYQLEINLELEKLSLVASKTTNSVIIFTNKGQIEWINNGFEDLLGYKLQDFKSGEAFKESRNKQHFVDLKRNMIRCIVKKEVVNYSSKVRLLNDNIKWFTINLTPIFNDKKVLTRVIGLGSDITNLKAKETQLTKKTNEIIDSINYAHRIQSSILTNEHILQSLFEKSFIFFKARDLVSGDFPWIYKQNNDIYIAVVDCTGHGVPGALLSITGHFFLNSIVEKNKGIAPGELLNKLHENIIIALKQHQGGDNARDGMDVALCKVNYKTMQIQYSGANRPLFIIQKGTTIEIKPLKRPVGGISFRKKPIKPFETNTVNFNTGDKLFMFTDGLSDQFGGPENKKFQTKQAKALFEKNANTPVIEFKYNLSESYTAWKGDNKQIDDVLAISIEL